MPPGLEYAGELYPLWACDEVRPSCDPRAHFGLGGVERFDAVKVLWPDGTEETFQGGTANQIITLRKGQGRKPAGPGEGESR